MLGNEKKLYIFGTGLFGEMANEYFTNVESEIIVCGFIKSQLGKDEKYFCNKQVLALDDFFQTIPAAEDTYIFVAVSSTQINHVREKYYNLFKSQGYKFKSWIDSSVCIPLSAQLGEHIVIMRGCQIGSFSAIGNNSIFWSGASVGHHCKLDDNVFMAGPSAIGGRCKVGKNAFLGLGSVVRDGVSIGSETVVGAGCLILRDTKPGSLFVRSENEVSKCSAPSLYGLDD